MGAVAARGGLMRLLLDMGLPRRAADLLREQGHDAVHLGERGLARLGDEEVLALAAEEDRIVVTLDADFSAILALSGASGPSVIHLRIEGLGYREAARVIGAVLGSVEPDLATGCIVSVTARGIRVRRLPLRPGV